MKLDVVEVTRGIVNFPSESLTSNVACTRHSARMLRQLGFQIESLPYTDASGVEKLSVVARLGKGTGGLALMSHNDVVPANMEDGWTGDPYEARVSDGRVIGRGSADMKGPLAASICAAARFKAGDLKAPLYIVITADEEISGIGARMVTDESRLFAEAAEGYGIVCEPTRLRVVYAHKAGMSFVVTSKGKPAHTSTLRGVNANLKMIPFLQEMAELNEVVLSAERFRNDEFDPPHSELTISVNDHNVAMNISPARSICRLSYRCMPGVDVREIVERVRAAARRHRLDCIYNRLGEPGVHPGRLTLGADRPQAHRHAQGAHRALRHRRHPLREKDEKAGGARAGGHRPSPHRGRVDRGRSAAEGGRGVLRLHRAGLRAQARLSRSARHGELIEAGAVRDVGLNHPGNGKPAPT